MKAAWLNAGFAKHASGSRPQNGSNGTTGVEPTSAPKSKTLKASPASRASVILNTTTVGAVNVHGGASRFREPIPGRQGTPRGSAGWQPDTNGKWPGSKPNSYHVPRSIGPASAKPA